MSRFGYKIWSLPRTWILIVAVTLIMLIVFWFRSANELSDRVIESKVQPCIAELELSSDIAPPKNSNSESESVFKLDTADYAQCEQFIQEIRSSSFSWGRENYEDWVGYLEQGYSLDDITLAIEHFTNSNFAASFRVKQLRKGTEFALVNQELNEQLRQQFPELANSGLSIERAVPLSALASFEMMTDEEKRQVLSEHQISVNDIAYFIHSGLSDNDIQMMLSHVTVPATTVSYEKLEAISLLDFAVAASRPMLVEALLLMGLAPTSDAYLGSSMEWALSRLSYADENTESNAVEVVKLLKLHGARARFQFKRQDKIEGSFPRSFYSFSKEQIAALWQNYQLDLTQIERREVPALEQLHPLVQTLAAHRKVFLAKKLGNPRYPVLQETCQQTLHVVDNQWQPKPAHEVVSVIEELYDGSPDRIISELADIDPLLVDIYRERLDRAARPMQSISIPPEAARLLQRGEVKQAIRYFEAQPFSDDEMRWLVTQILGYGSEYYKDLSLSSLWGKHLQDLNFRLLRSDIESIQTLEQAGANLRGADSKKKTLMYYAAERSDVSLVSFLKTQAYPFSLDDQGQDPLHVVLGFNHAGAFRKNIETLVDVIMEYQPDIDPFHRSRMAVIQLKNPRLYESIVSRYPELAISDDTVLPHVR